MRLFALSSSALCLIATVALATPSTDEDILARAHRTQLEFRAGNTSVAKPLVAMLESAVADSRDNAKLWESLGYAYMSLQGSLYSNPPDVPALVSAGERARDAFAHSMALHDASALLRANHGMSQMIVSQLQGDGPGMAAGVEEMNAAVRQSPESTGVRLTRGFSIIHLPPAMRDTPAVIEDLQLILDAAPGGRPADVAHLLLGDVHAEMGDLKAARAEYDDITGASAFAAQQVASRMSDLKKGAIPQASIAQVRMNIGTRCAMCHAPGTDD